MRFEINVNGAVFEWRNNYLHCSNQEAMDHLKQELMFHTPTLLAMPDLIDYDGDLTDGPNAYYAIRGTYPECEVIVDLEKKYLYEFDESVVY